MFYTRLLAISLPVILVLGGYFYYGKKQFSTGYLECQSSINISQAKVEEKALYEYRKILHEREKWDRNSLSVEEKIHSINEVSYSVIKKISSKSYCSYLGADVIGLLNSFQTRSKDYI